MIDTPDGLEEMADRLQRPGSCLAFDTEFVWERTYYPGLGIVQVGTEEGEVYLVDAHVLDDLSPLGRLLADAGIVKILHDAQQDLTILRRATGAYPRNVFDTRCAAAFAGMSSTLSLRDLLQQLLDVDLSKSETRADWLKRPLTEAQVHYAAEDVYYLAAARRELIQRVAARDRQNWLEDELAAFDAPELYDERQPDEQYLRVKGGGRLNARGLAVLRSLAAWRELEARRRDRPRSHIADDAALVQLARLRPRQPEKLGQVRELSSRKVSQYGEALLLAVRQGMEAEDCPRPPRRPRNESKLRRQLGMAIDHLRRKCRDCDIDSPFVASRAELKDLVRAQAEGKPQDLRLLRGWRREFLGAELVDMLAADER